MALLEKEVTHADAVGQHYGTDDGDWIDLRVEFLQRQSRLGDVEGDTE